MRLIAVLLLVLLVVSNLVWWLRTEDAPTRADPRTSTLIEENRALKREVAALREEMATPKTHSAPTKSAPTRPAAEPPRKSAPKSQPADAASQLRAASALSKAWVQEAFQLADPAKRRAAIDKIRNGFGSTDPVEQQAALFAFPQVAELDFDKESFRPLVLPLFEADDPRMRRAAVSALYHAGGPKPGDLDLILKLVDETPEVGTHAISSFSKRQLFGPAADAVLKILDTAEPHDLRTALAGISAARCSPELQARLIEMSAVPERRYDVIYYPLSTMRNKNEAVVDVLIEAMADTDRQMAQRAACGLGYGVVEAARPKVADALLAYFQSHPNSHQRAQLLRAIGQYGTRKHLEALERYADDTSLPEGLRQSVTQTVQQMRGRLAQ